MARPVDTVPARVDDNGNLYVRGAVDSDGNPVTVSVNSESVSKGYQQVTSTTTAATLASLCSGSALPTGATKVLLVPSAQIRIRDDGTSPTATVGLPIPADTEWRYDGDLIASLKVFGDATIDCWFFA